MGSTLFRDAWEHKEDTEAIHRLTQTVADEEKLSLKEEVMSNEEDENDQANATTDELDSSQDASFVLKPLKSSSMDNLAYEPLISQQAPIPARRSSAHPTPPASLPSKTISSAGSSIENLTSDGGHGTPMSNWSADSAEFRSTETPRTSPTAGLLENEVYPAYNEQGDCPGDCPLERSTPPVPQVSHLYPSPTTPTSPPVGS